MFNVPLQRQSQKTQALYQRYSKGIQKAGIACFSLEDASPIGRRRAAMGRADGAIGER